MSLTTDQLREALHAYADDLSLPNTDELVAGARHKRDHARKVRTAVLAGTAAVVMALVTVIGIQSFGHEKALTPAQLNKRHHTHFTEYTRGLKLTDIVEVPVRKVADPNSAGPVADAARVTLPKVGSTVYVVCDGSAIVGKNHDDWTETQVRSSGNTFTSCRPGSNTLLGGGKPGEHEKLWVVTDGTPTSPKASIAIYTQVKWADYAKKSAASKPEHDPLPADTPEDMHQVTFRGSGSDTVTKRVRVPASVARGAQLEVAPSSTGRFQVLVDGKAQRLDYSGLPASAGGPYGWLSPGRAPEVRGTWFDYWPDTANGNALGSPGTVAGPRPGATATIAIRAVDTKGSWKATLSWQKKQ